MMTEGHVITELLKCFPEREYARLAQVREGTGAYAGRAADLIVMSLWPSRGMEITGFEVKVSRSDWLRELKKPEKAEAICQFCDRWVIAVSGDDIARAEEMPPTWGLWVCAGGKVKEKVKAAKLEPQPITRSFLAALLRRQSEASVPKASIEAMLNERFEAGQAAAKSSEDWKVKQLVKDHKELTEAVLNFQRLSGIDINRYDAGRIGEAVAAYQALKGYGDHITDRFGRVASDIRTMADKLDELSRLIAEVEAEVKR